MRQMKTARRARKAVEVAQIVTTCEASESQERRQSAGCLLAIFGIELPNTGRSPAAATGRDGSLADRSAPASVSGHTRPETDHEGLGPELPKAAGRLVQRATKARRRDFSRRGV
jgi:hypothetical protein